MRRMAEKASSGTHSGGQHITHPDEPGSRPNGFNQEETPRAPARPELVRTSRPARRKLIRTLAIANKQLRAGATGPSPERHEGEEDPQIRSNTPRCSPPHPKPNGRPLANRRPSRRPETALEEDHTAGRCSGVGPREHF